MPTPPNVVYLHSHDTGRYVQPYGRQVVTPNIQRLADQGMLFVYPDERPRNFWMKDTSLPLSIAYLDAQGRIVRIADMTPFDTSPVPSVRPAMYALEVNQGWFTRHAVQVGASAKGVPPPSQH